VSYVFDDPAGTSIWIPSLWNGKMFVSMAECLTEALGVQAGLEEQASDWYRIDPAAFGVFIEKALRRGEHNQTFWELARGFLAISVVLLERLGLTVQAEACATRLSLEGELSLEALRRAMVHG
jgi:hypothetical protein